MSKKTIKSKQTEAAGVSDNPERTAYPEEGIPEITVQEDPPKRPDNSAYTINRVGSSTLLVLKK